MIKWWGKLKSWFKTTAWERAVVLRMNEFGGSPILDRPDHPWLAICTRHPFMTASFKTVNEAVSYAAWCIENDQLTQDPTKNFVIGSLRAFFTVEDNSLPAFEGEPAVAAKKAVLCAVIQTPVMP